MKKTKNKKSEKMKKGDYNKKGLNRAFKIFVLIKNYIENYN